MKTLTLTFICLLANLSLHAQAPPTGTIWYYHQSALFGENGDYIKIQIEKDTVLAGRICKKFIGGFGCAALPARGEFVYYENKKAYRYDFTRNQFWLLYDWGANRGDTVTIYVPRPTVVDSFKIRIDSISTWQPNGETLRIMQTSRIGASRWIYPSLQIIEKVGANAVYFPQFTACDPIQFGSLRCYNEPNRNAVTFVPYKCDTVIKRVGTSELLQNRHIEVFPTPSVSTLNLRLDERIEGGFRLSIANFLGQMVYQSPTYLETTFWQTDISQWQSGIYKLILTDRKGGQWQKSFAKMD
jgi:hypothetical protein